MTDAQSLERGRERFARKAWSDSHRLLTAADRDGALEPEDLERVATAAYLLGRDDESEAFRARAHQAFVNRGDHEGAARSAGWLAFGLLQRGAVAPASGWLARAARILDEAQLDCVVRGYLLIPSAIHCLVQGDAAGGHAAFSQAAEIASRFDDPDLASLARHGRGRALIQLGKIAEGVALLDEAMVAVALPTRNGLPIHDRGIVESAPGLYFVGLPFLYSLSSALLGGVGRDARHIADHIVSTRLSRMNDSVARAGTARSQHA